MNLALTTSNPVRILRLTNPSRLVYLSHRQIQQKPPEMYCSRLAEYGRRILFSRQLSNFQIRSCDAAKTNSLAYCTSVDGVAKRRLEDMDLTKLENAEDQILERLGYLMDMMEVEKAVKLVRKSAKIGVIPPKQMLINLIQQLANLGEYAALLDLYKVIKDEDMFPSSEFFHQLEQAYFQSQRIDEAVIMLRVLYHGIRKYEEVDLLFTTICMMILRHFPSEINLVQSFVDDCMHAERGQKNFRPAAGLWKCYILNEDLQGASKVLALDSEIRKFILDMVTDIVTNKNRVSHSQDAVLRSLVQMKELPLDTEQRQTLVEGCIECLFQQSSWKELLEVLRSVEESDVSRNFLSQFLARIEMSDDSDYELILCIEEANSIQKRKNKPSS